MRSINNFFRCLLLAGMSVLIAMSATITTNACTNPPPAPPPVWITCANDSIVYVTFHNYTTFGTTGPTFCACGLTLPPALGSILNVQIFQAGTNIPHPAFAFNPNPVTAFGFDSIAPSSAPWNGFSANVLQLIPPGDPIDITFCIALPGPCPNFAQSLALALGDGLIGTAGANSSGTPDHHIGISVPGPIMVMGPPGACQPGEQQVIISVTPSQFPGEISWELVDQNNNVVASGACGSYGPPTSDTICLDTSLTYVFNAFDDWGDGWNGGLVEIYDENGCLLLTAIPDNGVPGDETLGCTGLDLELSSSVPVGQPILGCTNPAAINYNPCAVIDDGSCIFPATNDDCSNAVPIVCGQTISGNTATASADTSLGTCGTLLTTAPGLWYQYTGQGQGVQVATCGSGYDTKLGVFSNTCNNLLCEGGNDDDCGLQSVVQFYGAPGSDYFIYVTGFGTNTGTFNLNIGCGIPSGCTDALALNYDPAAIVDDGSCIFAPPPGVDFENSTASLVLFGDTIPLAGPVKIRRDPAFINNDGLIEIPLEMEAMCLQGSHPLLGMINVNAGQVFGLDTTKGNIVQQAPGSSFFPAQSQINVKPKIDIENMSSICSPDEIQMGTTITAIPPCGQPYFAGSQLFIIIDCCTGDTLTTAVVHVAHELTCSGAPNVPQKMEKFSMITVSDSALNAGNVKLDLVRNGDCSTLVLTSGNVAVAAGQSAQKTAEDLAAGLALDMALNPACDADVSVWGNKILVRTNLPYTVNCCLKGTDLGTGVIIDNSSATNLGQIFEKEEVTELSTDFRCTCVPPNDTCGGAIEVFCGDSILGTTKNATTFDNPDDCGTSVTSPGVWYTITGTGDSITARTCGSFFDTKLSVYCVSGDSLICVAGNDDFCGLQSEVTWATQVDSTYKIFVHGFLQAFGDFILTIECENIDCDPPAHVWTDNISNSTASLHWTKVEGVYGYQITGSALGGAPVTLTVVGASNTTFDVKKLAAGVTFQWRVRSLCDNSGSSFSLYSERDTFTTKSVCTDPSPISTTILSLGSVRLNWTPVNSAIGYKVYGRAVGSSNIVVLNVPGGSSSSLVVNNLNTSLSYEWSVRSVCFNGSLSALGTPIQTFNFVQGCCWKCQGSTIICAAPTFQSNCQDNWVANANCGSSQCGSCPGQSERGSAATHLETPDDATGTRNVRIYPNPTAGQIYLQFMHTVNIEGISIEVYDVNGRRMDVKHQRIQNELTATLSLDHLNDGIYSIRIATAEQVSFVKVILAR